MSRQEAELQKLFRGSIPEHFKKMQSNTLGQISRPLVTRMLDQIGLTGEKTEPFVLFDNACGMGLVASELQSRMSSEVLLRSSMLSGDISEGSVNFVKNRIEKDGWLNAQAKVVDAQNNGLPSQSFTHVTTNIGLHVIPDSEAALKECIRILQPGGTLAFTTWHRCNDGWMTDVREAFATFPFEAPIKTVMQTTKWGAWADPNWIRRTLEENGLQDVLVDVQAHLTRVESAKSFVADFGVMIDWMMNANWSEETRKAHGREEVMGKIEGFLEKKHAGGSWDLTWLSIVASGCVEKKP